MSDSTIDLLYEITRTYLLYSNSFLLIIGSISNAFLMMIFIILRAFRRNQCAFFLTVECASNIILLYTNFLPYIYEQITGQYLSIISLIACRIQTVLSLSSGFFSLYTICFATFDQYLSTNPRRNWRQISSLKIAHRIILCNLCFVFLQSIPFLIFTENNPIEGCTVFNDALRVYLNFFYYPILSTAIPLIMTVTFSLLAYRNVRRIIRRQIPVFRRRLDRQLTAMILARVIELISLGLPYVCFSLYRSNVVVTNNNGLQTAILSLAGAFAYSLLYLNFSANLYLFTIISSRFRRQVKQFLLKKCWQSLKCFCQNTNIHRNENRVAPVTVRGFIFKVESVVSVEM